MTLPYELQKALPEHLTAPGAVVGHVRLHGSAIGTEPYLLRTAEGTLELYSRSNLMKPFERLSLDPHTPPMLAEASLGSSILTCTLANGTALELEVSTLDRVIVAGLLTDATIDDDERSGETPRPLHEANPSESSPDEDTEASTDGDAAHAISEGRLSDARATLAQAHRSSAREKAEDTWLLKALDAACEGRLGEAYFHLFYVYDGSSEAEDALLAHIAQAAKAQGELEVAASAFLELEDEREAERLMDDLGLDDEGLQERMTRLRLDTFSPPTTPLARYHAARASWTQGRDAEARALAEPLEHEKVYDYVELYGELHLSDSEREDQATTTLERAAETYPHYAEDAWDILGYHAFLRGDKARAQICLERAGWEPSELEEAIDNFQERHLETHEEEAARYITAYQWEAAQAVIQRVRALRQDPDLQAEDDRLLEVIERIPHGALEEAGYHLRFAASSYSEMHNAARGALARLLEAQGKLALAASLQADRTNAVTPGERLLERLESDAEDNERVVNEARLAYFNSDAPGLSEMWAAFHRVDALRGLERHKEAHQQVSALEGADVYLIKALAGALLMEEEATHAQGRALLEAAAQEHPRWRAEAFGTLALHAQYDAGDIEAATAYYEEAARAEEEPGFYTQELLGLYEEAGRWEEALPLIDALLEACDEDDGEERESLKARRKVAEKGGPSRSAPRLAQTGTSGSPARGRVGVWLVIAVIVVVILLLM